MLSQPIVTGPKNATIALIGDAPSASALARGVPFSANMEKLIGILLESAGINKSEVLMCATSNVLSSSSIEDRDRARKLALPELISALKARGVKKVVTFGNEVSQLLLGTAEKITSLRVGPPKRSMYGFDVIPTFNPLITFKQGDKLIDLETDFKKLKYTSNLEFKEFEYDIIDNVVDLEAFIATYTDSDDLIVLDIEVGVDKDISFEHPDKYRLLCLGIAVSEDKAFIITDDVLYSGTGWVLLNPFLHSKNIVCQNGKFDLNGLRPLFGKIYLFNDTMLMSYLIDERTGGHGLKQLSKEYLNAPSWEKELPPTKNFANVDRQVLYKYNAFDVIATYRLYNLFANMGVINPKTNRLLIDASNALQDVEYTGFKINLNLSDELIEAFEVLKDVRVAWFQNLTGIKGFNPNSPQQVKNYLYMQGYDVASTNADTIELLLEAPDLEDDVRNFCSTLLKYRGESNLLSTYLIGNRDKAYNGKLYPTYLLHGTTTGRLSCRNPNLQNIPRTSPIKEVFIPSHEDWDLCNTDYSQAELRTLSFLARDTYFRDIFNDGTIDVFDNLTTEIYSGVTKDNTDPATWKEYRTLIKTFVYGLSYGRTAYGIAKGFNMPVDQAEKHMKKFWSVLPEIKAYTSHIKRQVRDGHTLVTPYGRKRSFPMISKENINDVENEALAFTPQSTASDMTLTAMINAINQFKELGMRSRVVNIVHDAIMYETPKNETQDAIKIIERAMLKSADDVVNGYVKFAVETSIGKNWGELK